MNESNRARHHAHRTRNGHNAPTTASGAKTFAAVVRSARSDGETFAHRIREHGTRLADAAQERGRGAWSDAVDWVQENPGRAVGSAFLAGFVLAAYAVRRRD